MKKFIDQQPSPHETSAKSPLEKVTTAIAKDNEHHREVMLALHDANILEYEEDIYNQEALPTIKADQQEALEEFVRTGDKSVVPAGVLQRYQEERASCEATLTEIAEKEEQPMEKGGYKTEGKIAKILADLGHAALTPNKAAKRVDEMYEATRLAKTYSSGAKSLKIGLVRSTPSWHIIWASQSHPWQSYLRKQQFVSGVKKRLRKRSRPTMRASPGILMSFLIMTEHHAQTASWGMVAV